jgi:hypothetical protein
MLDGTNRATIDYALSGYFNAIAQESALVTAQTFTLEFPETFSPMAEKIADEYLASLSGLESPEGGSPNSTANKNESGVGTITIQQDPAM